MKNNPALWLLPFFILAYLYCKYFLKLGGGLEIMMLGASGLCLIFAVGRYFQK